MTNGTIAINNQDGESTDTITAPTAKDHLSGIAGDISYSISGGAGSNPSGGSVSNGGTFTPTFYSNDPYNADTFTITFTAYDNAGNYKSTSTTVTPEDAIEDQTGPTWNNYGTGSSFQETNTGYDYNADGYVQVNWTAPTAVDETSTISTISLRFHTITYATITYNGNQVSTTTTENDYSHGYTCANGGTVTTEWQATGTGLTDGASVYLYYRATDAAGNNSSEAGKYNLRVDGYAVALDNNSSSDDGDADEDDGDYDTDSDKHSTGATGDGYTCEGESEYNDADDGNDDAEIGDWTGCTY